MPPVIYTTDEKNRIEVDYKHFYSANCRCMSCLEMFLAIEEGVVVIKDSDNRQMNLPKRGRKFVILEK